MIETKKKKKGQKYWTKEQEDAVKEYLKMDPDSKEANLLFETKILGPLTQIVENIMFTYKLNVKDIPLDEQILDTLSFVTLKMRKFDPDKGHKAFSYFGTIAKHYLIACSTKNYKKKLNSIPLEDVLGFEYDQEIYDSPEFEKEFNSYEYFLTIISNNIDNLIKNDMTLHPNVYKVGEAVVYMLKNYQYMGILNKRQFYFVTKEFTGLQAKDITKALKKLKEVFKETYKSVY